MEELDQWRELVVELDPWITPGMAAVLTGEELREALRSWVRTRAARVKRSGLEAGA